jgi:hypothetical protein
MMHMSSIIFKPSKVYSFYKFSLLIYIDMNASKFTKALFYNPTHFIVFQLIYFTISIIHFLVIDFRLIYQR